MAFSPDGKRIVSAGADSSVKVWDPDTGEETKLGMRHWADARLRSSVRMESGSVQPVLIGSFKSGMQRRGKVCSRLKYLLIMNTPWLSVPMGTVFCVATVARFLERGV